MGVTNHLLGWSPKTFKQTAGTWKSTPLQKGDTSTANQQFLGFQSLVDSGVESVKIFDILNIQYFTIP